MKKSILILAAMTFISLGASAQHERKDNDEGRREKIEAWKIGFITESLQLTPQEAQAFWPIFNEFENKRQEDRQSMMTELPEDHEAINSMTDEQAEQLIQKHLQHEQQMVDLKKEYYQKLKGVLPVKKIFLLFEAESNFKRILLDRLYEHHPSERGFDKH